MKTTNLRDPIRGDKLNADGTLHSPEPWHVLEAGGFINILDANQTNLLPDMSMGDFSVAEIKEVRRVYHRIVACVNACIGITTQTLEE